jgi:hypothetical protein
MGAIQTTMLVCVLCAISLNYSWTLGSGAHWLATVAIWGLATQLLKRRFERVQNVSVWLAWLFPALYAVSSAIYSNEVVGFFGPIFISFSLLMCLLLSLMPSGSILDLSELPLKGPLTLVGGLASCWTPLSQLLETSDTNRGRLGKIIQGLMLGGMVGGVFSLLFAAADHEFGQLLSNCWESLWYLDIGTLARMAILSVILLGVTHQILTKGWARSREPRATQLGSMQWTISLAMTACVFALFLSSQLGRMFTPASRINPARMSAYAHEGFGELWLVTFLVFVMAYATYRLYLVPSPEETDAPLAEKTSNTPLVATLATLVLLSLVVAGSAFHRLYLYSEHFGLSVLRIYAILGVASLVFLKLILLLALKQKPTVRALNTGLILAGGLVFAMVGLTNVEALAVRSHLALIEKSSNLHAIDVEYLSGFSLDAVPTLEQAGLKNPKLKSTCDQIASKIRQPKAPKSLQN